MLTRLIAAILAALSVTPATRTISGEVYRIDYPTGYEDAPTIQILTADGNLWEMDTFIYPRFHSLEVTFDTKGTEDISDDEIIRISAVWEP